MLTKPGQAKAGAGIDRGPYPGSDGDRGPKLFAEKDGQVCGWCGFAIEPGDLHGCSNWGFDGGLEVMCHKQMLVQQPKYLGVIDSLG
jgi:hypothetical protein